MNGAAPAWKSLDTRPNGPNWHMGPPHPRAWFQSRHPNPSNMPRDMHPPAWNVGHDGQHKNSSASMPHGQAWQAGRSGHRPFTMPHEHSLSPDERGPKGSSRPQKGLKRKAGIFQRGTTVMPKSKGTSPSLKSSLLQG